MNLYVGNLSVDVTDEDLRKAFEVYGKVASASVIKDRFSQESRGFGFVEMPEESEAREAIAGLSNQEIKGRYLKVNEAKPQSDKRNQRGGKGRGPRRW